MSWMNASAVAAADARNRASEMELNAVESPDGMGTRWQEAAQAAKEAAAACERAAAEAAQAAKEEAEAAQACERAAAEQAAFETHPLVAESGVRMVEDMDSSGNGRWMSAADFAAKYPDARVVGREAKCTTWGYGFRVKK